jgi:predicted nucleic acid-binding protein
VIVVSDTSPLSYLSKLDRLNLLPQMFETVALPPEVLSEWERDASSTTVRRLAQNAGWLRVIAPTNQAKVTSLEERVDRGEAEAIVLAEELNADLLLIDDEDGREIANQCGLAITGVLGVLLRAKRAGLISAVRPEIERLLKETTFFCSEALFQNLLNLAGE